MFFLFRFSIPQQARSHQVEIDVVLTTWITKTESRFVNSIIISSSEINQLLELIHANKRILLKITEGFKIGWREAIEKGMADLKGGLAQL